MTVTTDFISELIRAANEINKLAPIERRNLMARASRTIREMRIETGVRAGRGRDRLFDLEVAALKSETGSNDDAKAVMLEMAEMIRTLKIVLDGKYEILKGG